MVPLGPCSYTGGLGLTPRRAQSGERDIIGEISRAGDAGFRRALAPIVAKAAEKAGKLLLENRFDGCADVAAQPILDRVEPGLCGQ